MWYGHFQLLASVIGYDLMLKKHMDSKQMLHTKWSLYIIEELKVFKDKIQNVHAW